MPHAALLLLLLFAGLAAGMFWPAFGATALRQIFRNWPDARDTFVGRRGWISFSRRFGRIYALGAFALAFAWILVGGRLVPHTTVGAWLLFAPAFLLLVVSVTLAALVVLRWVVDD